MSVGNGNVEKGPHKMGVGCEVRERVRGRREEEAGVRRGTVHPYPGLDSSSRSTVSQSVSQLEPNLSPPYMYLFVYLRQGT